MEKSRDAFGEYLLAQFHQRHQQTPSAEFIERDDNYLDTGSMPGLYFSEYEQWSAAEQQVLERVKGKVLDIGCGAGRHSLYLQQRGFDVTAIDKSPGAIEVCRLRKLKHALIKSIAEVDELPESFDTILMLGNNFGLFGGAANAKEILKKFSRITSAAGTIIAGTRNPYKTDNTDHLEYHEFNRRRGRMAGQIRMRFRFGRLVGDWFDYLFVSPEEMVEIVKDSDWRIQEFIDAEKANYVAIIGRKSGSGTF